MTGEISTPRIIVRLIAKRRRARGIQLTKMDGLYRIGVHKMNDNESITIGGGGEIMRRLSPSDFSPVAAAKRQLADFCGCGAPADKTLIIAGADWEGDDESMVSVDGYVDVGICDRCEEESREGEYASRGVSESDFYSV